MIFIAIEQEKRYSARWQFVESFHTYKLFFFNLADVQSISYHKEH